jgi:hypothetical protein
MHPVRASISRRAQSNTIQRELESGDPVVESLVTRESRGSVA